MDNLLFTLNAILPLILPIVLGYVLRRIKLFGRVFLTYGNKLVFTVFIPVLIFNNLYMTNFSDINWKIAVFVFAASVGMFLIGWLQALPFKKYPTRRSVVHQSAFNSNYAVIGFSLSVMLAGQAAGTQASVAAAVIVLTVNLLAVIAFTMYGDGSGSRPTAKQVVLKIVTNPLIISVVISFIFMFIRWAIMQAGVDFTLSEDNFFAKTLDNLAAVAMPLALVVLGGQFSFGAAGHLWKEIAISSVSRLIILPVICIVVAYAVGMRSATEMAVIISVCATPVAVSSSPMAIQMGQDGELAGQLIVWTTLFSAVSLFLIIFTCSSIGIL